MASSGTTMAAVRGALTVAILAWLPGCVVAAAGAGAGGAVYITSRGAETTLNASVDDVAQAVTETFDDLGIPVGSTKSEKGGDEREVSGKTGDLDVNVHFERRSPTSTKVEVTARKNLAEWDKDYARKVLQGIVEKA
jgi:hypothetical protein